MKAEVAEFDSSDADLDSYAPSDRKDFGILVRMIARPRGSIGEESFDVMVCTPRWLSHEVESDGPQLGRHYLIVNEWDWDQIQAFLRNAVESEEAEDWHELAQRIGRIGLWEFEDYRP